MNFINLKNLDPRKKVSGVFEYHIHQGQHIQIYAWAANYKHMLLFQVETLNWKLNFKYHVFGPT
jgi:hypothetical protein